MTRFRRLLVKILAVSAMTLAGPVMAQQGSADWSASWASAQMLSEGEDVLAGPTDDVTIRQIVRLSAGGEALRIRVSNRFGREPLRIAGARAALAAGPGQSAIEPGSDRPATFGGEVAVSIPPGAEYVSDPIDLAVMAGDDLAISLHVADMPDAQTGHPGARATAFVASGDQLSAMALDDPRAITRWYMIAAVDVRAEAAAVIALIGDSITDGYGVPSDTNQRWSDQLAARLRSTPGLENAAVLNLGIGGNRMLLDGLGPNTAARFDHDVLGQTGVTHVIVLEGVNDLGHLTRNGPASAEAHAAMVRDLTQSYTQIVARAREKGVVAIGATIMPFATSGYYHPGPETEADRQAVNAWIRTPGNFDAVIDFDAATRDPDHPDRLRAEVDNGDGLHPSMAGYRAMADAVPLGLFERKP